MVELLCSICMYQTGRPTAGVADAVMVINGQSVCMNHANYVQGGVHSQALANLKEEADHDARSIR